MKNAFDKLNINNKLKNMLLDSQIIIELKKNDILTNDKLDEDFIGAIENSDEEEILNYAYFIMGYPLKNINVIGYEDIREPDEDIIKMIMEDLECEYEEAYNEAYEEANEKYKINLTMNNFNDFGNHPILVAINYLNTIRLNTPEEIKIELPNGECLEI